MENNFRLFINISAQRMCQHYLPKLLEAIRCLDEKELWLCETEETNSIGGIVLHICEHIRRNTLQLSNSAIQFSSGIEEYFPNVHWASAPLCEYVQKTFAEWQKEMEELLENPDKLDMHRIYHLVEHTAYHLGQIIDRTKRLKRISFQFCQKGLNEKSLREMIEAKCIK
ncbi:DinB family protein [Anoxybacteroides tepidamans]|uniref:DinB family protein n=1 Tax=Anoxybacteroides tepidamans TaxID=265948 RepID=UPI0004807BCC|nr:hypothetical protein [Anoxybacillus tepidamans]